MTLNRNNYEEYFLLYIDGELDGDERLLVEDFVRLHPDLEKEFILLKQTVSIPPVMIFESKEKLFKKEKKRRLLPVYLMRIAATAVILLAGGWFLLRMAGKTGRHRIPVPSGNVALYPEKKSRGNAGTAANPEDTRKERPASGAETNAASSGKNKSVASRKTSNTGGENPGPVMHYPLPVVQLPDRIFNNQRSEMPAPGLPAPLHLTASGEINLPTGPVPSGSPGSSPAPGQPLAGTPQAENASATSIFVFNDKNKTVGGFFRKLTAESADAGIPTAGHRHRIKISVFQFELSK